MRFVNVTEFRNNISYYIELSAKESIHITRNGETVAILSNPDNEYYQTLVNIFL